jgi:hypothetical protein
MPKLDNNIDKYVGMKVQHLVRMVWIYCNAFSWHMVGTIQLLDIVKYHSCKISNPFIWLFWISDGNEMFVTFVANFQTYLHFSLVAITQNFGLTKYESMYMSFKNSTNFFQYMSFKLIIIIMFMQAMNFFTALLLLLMLEKNVFWWAYDGWSFCFPLNYEEKLIS